MQINKEIRLVILNYSVCVCVNSAQQSFLFQAVKYFVRNLLKLLNKKWKL